MVDEELNEEEVEVMEDEKIEASHDGEEVAPKVAPVLTKEDQPSVNEELFMVGDEATLGGVDFIIKEVSGLALKLVRKDFK